MQEPQSIETQIATILSEYDLNLIDITDLLSKFYLDIQKLWFLDIAIASNEKLSTTPISNDHLDIETIIESIPIHKSLNIKELYSISSEALVTLERIVKQYHNNLIELEAVKNTHELEDLIYKDKLKTHTEFYLNKLINHLFKFPIVNHDLWEST